MLLGSDTEGLFSCVTEVLRHRDEIRKASQRMERIIEAANWVGPDRENFVDSWTSRYRPMLYSTAHELAEDATRLKNHAERQRATSGE